MVRRHPVTFVPYFLLFVFMVSLPVIGYILFPDSIEDLLTGPISMPLIIMSAAAYYLSVLLFFYSFFVEFYLDCWIITNDRLFDIRQISLFARTIAEVDLYQIQDVSSEVKGIFPTIFNYGNVYLQTAGTVPKFILSDVPNPDHLRQLIIELSSKDKQFHNK